MKNQNKLNVIACGGAGINIARALVEKYKEVPSVTPLSVTAMDTSRMDISPSDDFEFHHIRSHEFGEAELTGSGGRRMENATAISKEIVKVIESDKVMSHQDPSVFHVVVGSMSGGTGSVAAPVVASKLMELGHNVLLVGVSDTSSEQQTTNSMSTLNLCTRAALKHNRNLAMVLLDNAMFTTVEQANEHAISSIVTLGIMLSESVISIDQKDMSVLLNPKMLSDEYTIPDGIVEIKSFINEPGELEENSAVLVHRELRNDTNFSKSSAIAYKKGTTTGDLDNFISNNEMYALSLQSIGGSIAVFKKHLEDAKEAFATVDINNDYSYEDPMDALL